jgi:tRNA threonylcarbamoyladenosine biosynthesis protein TsaB
VTDSAEAKLLILETSGRVGQVAVALGERLLGQRRLDEARRHARDLAPAVRDLLSEQGWEPRELQAVIVGRGPGSYTGLRVGIMSAKAFAYATGCALLAIDTFASIAQQAPQEVQRLDVLADAQQDKVYVQRFVRSRAEAKLQPETPLTIQPFAEWLTRREEPVWVSGPGLHGLQQRLPPGTSVVDARLWSPLPESLLHPGWQRYGRGERDEVWSVEPLYLRPSSAEEKWGQEKR